MTRDQLLIEGPTVRGTFFIRDESGRIWDGQEWRGFGHAAEFQTFRAALQVSERLLEPEQMRLQ
jgi:hypothetical protein